MGDTIESVLNWPDRVPETPICIWIVGGSFQGKSLVAASLAIHLGIPHVINTDFLRNVIRSQHSDPPSWLGTSTYLLSRQDLEKQFEAVSNLMRKVLAIYRKRGESVIVEGMHVSPDLLLAEALRPDTLVVGLNNTAGYEKRIRTKVQTTRLGGSLDKYRVHAGRVESIHRELLGIVRDVGGWIVRFGSPDSVGGQIAQKIEGRFRFVSMRSREQP